MATKNQKTIEEIEGVLKRKGWTIILSGYQYQSSDGNLELVINTNVMYLYDKKRNKTGIKVASLVLKDVMVLPDAIRTEFLQINL